MDRIGGAIPGVTVTTIPQSGGLARNAMSGSDGSYRFDGLPDGTYRVDFEFRNFDLVRRNHVRVHRDTQAMVDATLRLRAICECIAVEPPSPWAQRAGQVIDKTGHPLPHARIELVGRQVMSTDGEGRFLIRLPVNELWPLTATDTGYRAVTQQVSGADAASVVLSLEYVGTTGVPDYERFGACECPGYLLSFGGQRRALRAAATLTGEPRRGQRRALLREDHREELRGLCLACVFRDLVRRAGLFVEHLPGRVRLFIALPRNLGDDGALEDVDQHKTGVVVCRADTSGRVVDVADRHFPVVQRHVRQIVFEDRRTRNGRWRGRRGLRLAAASWPDATSSANSANEATASRRVIIMARIIAPCACALIL